MHQARESYCSRWPWEMFYYVQWETSSSLTYTTLNYNLVLYFPHNVCSFMCEPSRVFINRAVRCSIKSFSCFTGLPGVRFLQCNYTQSMLWFRYDFYADDPAICISAVAKKQSCKDTEWFLWCCSPDVLEKKVLRQTRGRCEDFGRLLISLFGLN